MVNKMKRLLKLSTLLSILGFLAACTMDKAGCDPRAMRDAGLLTKMNCDFSGSYDARAKDQETKLAEERQTNALLRSALSNMEKQNNLTKASVEQRRADVTAISRSTGAYLRQLQKTNAGNKALNDKIKVAMAKLVSLENTSPADPKALEAQIKGLKTEIEEMQKSLNN
jgi:hypothetical protein